MTAKPVVLRDAARRDIDEALDYYLREASGAIARSFIEALELALALIADYPAAGSARYDHELNLPGLRSRILKRYPYIVFYMAHEDHINIWRVL